MLNGKKVDYYEDLEYQEQEDHFGEHESSTSKKKKRLDPYDKHKERRNSKINPRFISLDEDEY